MRFALLALLAAGCTRGNPQLGGDPDLAVVPIGDLAGAYDLTAPTFDLSVVAPDLSGADLAAIDLAVVRDLARADLAGGPCIRINEVSVASVTDPNDEYVELVNVCDAEVRIDGWSLRYRSITNNNGPQNIDSPLVNFGAFAVAGHGYLLFGGSAYTGTTDGTLATGLASAGGGVGIVDQLNLIVDSVAYGGVVSSHNFIEGTQAPAPPAGMAISRTPDGRDSDNNSLDFQVTARTPRATNL